METQMTQRRQGGGIVNFLVGLVCIAMVIAFGVMTAQALGYLGQPGASSPAAPQPTPIIRVVAPQPPAAQQFAPAQSAPIEQPAPAVALPRPAQPAVVPAPVVEQPAAPPVRQIIIVKNGNDPAAAPIVIDRGTKRKSP